LQGDSLADRKDARNIALRCIELATKARMPELKRILSERAKLAAQHAIGLGCRMGLRGRHRTGPSVGHDDGESLRVRLEAASLRLAEGERLVADWRKLIADSEARGEDTASSRDLLRAFEAYVEEYRASRDLLQRQIDERNGSPRPR
jgi:hypothetical protein